MKRKNLRILIIGPQGSGKTTQSKLLSEYLGVPYIETGEHLRKLSKENTFLGRKVKDILDKGEMVSDDLAAEIVEKRLKAKDVINGFVMNGYPRNLNQIKLFKQSFDKVLYIEIDDREALNRLLKRGREDDTSELIKKRLSDYHKLTKPILEYYQKLGILETVDGVNTIDATADEIRSALDG